MNDPEAEEVYCTRDFDFCAEEEDSSSYQAGGSNDDENFLFHEGTDISSAGECSSKSGYDSAMISNSFSCGISEAHGTHYDLTISDTTDETAESTTVWNTRFDRAYETRPDSNVSATGVTDKAQESATWSLTGGNKVFRGFASNIEQNENAFDDYVIRPENVERKNVDLIKSKPIFYHLKHGNLNLRCFDNAADHVTLRLVSDNECQQSDSHPEGGESSEHFLEIKELKLESLEKESSDLAFDSDDESSIHAALGTNPLVDKEIDSMNGAIPSHLRKDTAMNSELLNFGFRPENEFIEVKFRQSPGVTCLQYKSEKAKLYFKRKHF